MITVRGRAAVAVVCFAAAACLFGGCGGGRAAIEIGVIAPSSGDLSALGKGIAGSVRLAVEQANARDALGGRRLEVVVKDDHADPATGARAARELVREGVAAVIGTYNSGVAAKVQPILDRAGIAMISPGNTDPALTLGPRWRADQERPYDTYFRVVANDRDQGRYCARYAAGKLGIRRAAVVHHSKDVSRNLALIFADAFRREGGTVTGVFEADTPAEIRRAVGRAAAQNPELVFIGGEYPYGGLVVKDMRAAGLEPPDVVAMGGDGLVDRGFVEAAGSQAAEGHYASLVGATAEFLPASKAFTDAYRKRFGRRDWSAFGPPAYDAANIAIRAIAGETRGGRGLDDGVRRRIVAAIQHTTYRGALGTTSFDPFGDTTDRLLTMNRVEGGRWKALGAERL